MAGPRPMQMLGDMLSLRRRRRFVGRTSEIELFRTALDTTAHPSFSVLHMCGPGGIGKTRLLDAFEALADAEGARVLRLDGRELDPTPQVVQDATASALDGPAGEADLAGPFDGVRVVLLVDAYEWLVPLDLWFRTSLLPRLPATAVTVIAGREVPTSAWRADPGWTGLLRAISLRNLGPQECRDYLRECGIDPARHEQLLGITHGHPLRLSAAGIVLRRFRSGRSVPARSCPRRPGQGPALARSRGLQARLSQRPRERAQSPRVVPWRGAAAGALRREIPVPKPAEHPVARGLANLGPALSGAGARGGPRNHPRHGFGQ